MLVWPLDQNTIHLRIILLKKEDNASYDFVLDKDDFISKVELAYNTFHECGGWGERDYEDDD